MTETLPENMTLHLFFEVPRHAIGYVRFIVEAYEGLAQVRSMPRRNLVEWIVPIGLVEQSRLLANALQNEVGLKAIDPPADWSGF